MPVAERIKVRIPANFRRVEEVDPDDPVRLVSLYEDKPQALYHTDMQLLCGEYHSAQELADKVESMTMIGIRPDRVLTYEDGVYASCSIPANYGVVHLIENPVPFVAVSGKRFPGENESGCPSLIKKEARASGLSGLVHHSSREKGDLTHQFDRYCFLCNSIFENMDGEHATIDELPDLSIPLGQGIGYLGHVKQFSPGLTHVRITAYLEPIE